MAEQLSTGFVNAQNIVGSFKAIMDGGVICGFSGQQPAGGADAAETGDLLIMYTKDGATHTPGAGTNGIVMASTSAAGVILGNGDTIKGVGLAAAGASPGKAVGWLRWYDKNYTTGASETAVRIDMAAGTSTAYEAKISNPQIVEGVESKINSISYRQKKS